MNANNYLFLTLNKDKILTLQECDADTGGVITNLGLHPTLDSAVKKTQRYMKNNEVEYGLKIKL